MPECVPLHVGLELKDVVPYSVVPDLKQPVRS